MKYKKEDIENVLSHNCFKKCDYYNGTFREFLADCLKELWKETECFSGKRPICDSGWEDIAGEALSILEPKIGKYCEHPDESDLFEVHDRELYLETFNWIIDYIFKI